jgi:nicotinamide riboside transporter PnuC
MSVIALAGTVLNAERNILGFLFWLISNLYMSIRFAYIGEYAQATLFLIYFLLAIRGIIVWQKKNKHVQ